MRMFTIMKIYKCKKIKIYMMNKTEKNKKKNF